MHPTSGIKTTKIEQKYTRMYKNHQTARNPSYLRGICLQCHESTDLLLSTASVCKNLQNANLDLPVKVSIKTLHGRAWPWRTKECTRSSQNPPHFSIDSDRHSWVTGMERDLQMSPHSKTLRKANWCPARCHPPLKNWTSPKFLTPAAEIGGTLDTNWKSFENCVFSSLLTMFTVFSKFSHDFLQSFPFSVRSHTCLILMLLPT